MTNIVLSPRARPAKLALAGRLAAVTRALWKRMQEERRVRSTLWTLHRLNDHTLRDIGLERDNIEPVVRSGSRGR
jgi:uncharacterized protein YjiS (DUF1127 family)